jgi:hypothetical protein
LILQHFNRKFSLFISNLNKKHDLQIIIGLEKSLKEELDKMNATKMAKLKAIEQLKDDIKRDEYK